MNSRSLNYHPSIWVIISLICHQMTSHIMSHTHTHNIYIYIYIRDDVSQYKKHKTVFFCVSVLKYIFFYYTPHVHANAHTHG